MKEKVLQSLIITHGFFDIYNKNYNIMFEKTFIYLLLIFINYYLINLIPLLILFGFLILSGYHFSLDFKYLKINNYKLYGPIILLSTITDFNKLLYWQEKINNIIYVDTISQIILFTILNIMILNLITKISIYKFKKFFSKIYCLKKTILFTFCVFLINVYLDSPYHFILYYLGFIHTPLAMYRYSNIYNYNIIKYWIFLSFIVYSFLIYYDDYILNIENSKYYRYLSNFIISILNTHIIYNLF